MRSCGCCASERVEPGTLLLEITESAVMRDPQLAVRNMQLLRIAGVRFAIDDFGTGHSSLSQLSVLPVDELKIDRSFIAQAASGAVTILTSTIELGHSMGLKVVAEGVEEPGAWNLLRRLGLRLRAGLPDQSAAAGGGSAGVRAPGEPAAARLRLDRAADPGARGAHAPIRRAERARRRALQDGESSSRRRAAGIAAAAPWQNRRTRGSSASRAARCGTPPKSARPAPTSPAAPPRACRWRAPRPPPGPWSARCPRRGSRP